MAAEQAWSSGAVAMTAVHTWAGKPSSAADAHTGRTAGHDPWVTRSEYTDGWFYQGGASKLACPMWAAGSRHYTALLCRDARETDVSVGRWTGLEAVVGDAIPGEAPPARCRLARTYSGK